MAKILIVDDSDVFRSQLKKDLEGNAHSVIIAFDGADGIEKFHANTGIDLIISDVNMPNMDGLSMCARITPENKNPKLKIFLLTTEASAELKAKGKSVGVNAWITKPYVLDSLLKAIDKVCPK